MVAQMNVYIVVRDWEYEGYGEPEKAFDTEEKAQVYLDMRENNSYRKFEIFELEIE